MWHSEPEKQIPNRGMKPYWDVVDPGFGTHALSRLDLLFLIN